MTEHQLRRDSKGRFKEMDPEIRSLGECMKAIESIEKIRMRRATLEFLWDKYVIHAKAQEQ